MNTETAIKKPIPTADQAIHRARFSDLPIFGQYFYFEQIPIDWRGEALPKGPWAKVSPRKFMPAGGVGSYNVESVGVTILTAEPVEPKAKAVRPDPEIAESRNLYARLPASGANAGEEISRGTGTSYTHAIVAERENDGETVWSPIGWTSKPKEYIAAEEAFYKRWGCFRATSARQRGITGRLQAVPAYRKTLAQEHADNRAAREAAKKG